MRRGKSRAIITAGARAAGVAAGVIALLDASAPACPPVDTPAAEADVILGDAVNGIEFVGAVAPAGDVDGDGVDDLAVASAHDDDLGEVDLLGRSLLVSGATFQILAAFTGEQEGDVFGRGVAHAGDADGDGFADALFGSNVDNGTVHLYSGRTSTLIRTYEDGLTLRLSNCPGDVNGDGVLDHMTWAPGGDDDVRVYDGATGALLHFFDGIFDFGRAAGTAGDVDGDGRDDIVIGGDNPMFGNGVVYVYSGATGRVLHQIDGTETNSELGSEVGPVGDVNRDGLADFAAAAPESDIGALSAGVVYIYSGADGSQIRAHIGDRVGLELASAIATIGDLTGDGVEEYVLTAVTYGDAFVHSGRTGALLARMTGEADHDLFGHSLATADLDLDGLHDLAVAAPEAGADERGRVYVFLTPPGGYLEPADLDGDGDVDVDDLLITIIAWGPCPAPPDPCRSDTDGNGATDVDDLVRLLSCWSISG